MVRALVSRQYCLGSVPAGCHMWLAFVVGCSEGFSPGSPVFLPAQKTTSPNSNSSRIEDPFTPLNSTIYLRVFSSLGASNILKFILKSHYKHSISADAKIMVSKNCAISGEHVAVNFVAQ